MKVPAHVTTAILIIICALASLSVSHAEELAIDAELGAPLPADLHRYLGEAKAQAELDKRFARKLSLTDRLEDTQFNYDVLFYDVFIKVDDTAESVSGDIRFVALAAADGVTEVQVDLNANMVVDDITGPVGTISYTRSDDVITVGLGQTYDLGDQMEFTVSYHGQPQAGGFKAFSFGDYYGERIISSLSEPYYARSWWPCKDRMDDKPDSFDIAIEVDTVFYVGSNGVLDSIIGASPNTHTFYYRERYPMAAYLFSVAICDFEVWTQQYRYNGGADSMPIVHAVFPDKYVQSQDTWGMTPVFMTALVESFGPYPFLQEKYGHANFDWGGGMEHQTMTSMGGSAFYWSIIVHELAHQWWGDMITCESWQDIWLNEGWASYAEAVYQLEAVGWDSYRNYMGQMAYTGGGTVYAEDTTSVSAIFHGGLSYDKGAWVVHMLRGVLGEEAFANGIYDYYHSEYQYGALTTEEFKNLFELSSGVELDYFFDQWIHGEYRPNYNWYYATEPSGSGQNLYIMIEQVQTTSPEMFTMPVEFLVDFQTMPSDTVSGMVDADRKLLKFYVSDDVDTVIFDPAYWILKYESNLAWDLFLTTLDEDLSEGFIYVEYEDTIHALGGGGAHTFALAGGNLPPGLTLAADGTISGVPSDTGSYTFTVAVSGDGGGSDSANSTIHVASQCCGEFTSGYTGNTNRSTDGLMTLSDITLLIDRIYVTGGPLECDADGNVNGSVDDKLTLSDIAHLIDHVYINHGQTARCR